jgi:tetratricopeptide (TPR) repeat protein
LPALLALLPAMALAIKHLREPDLWWQLRTGEWILQHGRVPVQDPFSYTFAGANWVNIKWGSEVILALLSRLGGPEWMLLPQMLASAVLVLLLYAFLRLWVPSKERSPLFHLLLPCSALILLLGTAYRMNGRPELYTHVFSLLMILLLERAKRQEGRSLFLLPILQLAWVNLHEAFGMGLVISAAYAADSLLAFRSPHRAIPLKRLAIPLLLQFVAVFANPYGLQMLLKPLEIFGQLYTNQYTTELLGFAHAAWWKREAFIFITLWICLPVLAVLHHLLFRRRLKELAASVWKEYGLAYFFLLIAFSYLGLNAYRNLVFPILLLIPAVTVLLYRLLKRKPGPEWLPWLGIAPVLAFHLCLISNVFYKNSGGRDHYGLGIWPLNNPLGAAEYLEKHSRKGEKIFSDYLSSSYLLWRLQPDFKTFIDLRDLDVFPASFFALFSEAVNDPAVFDSLDAAQRFDKVVLYRLQFQNLHRHLFESGRYRLVYADAVAAVYAKGDSGATAAFRLIRKAEEPGALSKVLNRLFHPAYQGMAMMPEDQYAAGVSFWLALGRRDAAAKLLEEAMRESGNTAQVLETAAQLLYAEALDMQADLRMQRMQLAGQYFRRALEADERYIPAQMGLGAVFFQQGRYTESAEAFEKAADLDPENLQACLYSAEAYKALLMKVPGNTEYQEALVNAYEKALMINPDNPMLELNLGMAWLRRGDCGKALPRLEKCVGFEGFSPADRQALEQALRRCGTELNI